MQMNCFTNCETPEFKPGNYLMMVGQIKGVCRSSSLVCQNKGFNCYPNNCWHGTLKLWGNADRWYSQNRCGINLCRHLPFPKNFCTHKHNLQYHLEYFQRIDRKEYYNFKEVEDLCFGAKYNPKENTLSVMREHGIIKHRSESLENPDIITFRNASGSVIGMQVKNIRDYSRGVWHLMHSYIYADLKRAVDLWIKEREDLKEWHRLNPNSVSTWKGLNS